MNKRHSEMMMNITNAGASQPTAVSPHDDARVLHHGEKGMNMKFLLRRAVFFLGVFIVISSPTLTHAAGTVNRAPTSDIAISGATTSTGTTHYNLLSDATNTTYSLLAANANNVVLGFAAINPADFPTGAIITNVTVNATAYGLTATSCAIAPVVRTDTTNNLGTAMAAIVSATAVTRTGTFTINPATSAAWTVEQVTNTAASNNLSGFGVQATDANPDVYVTEVSLTINYTVPGTIALSSATYSVSEAGPSVTITATRTGGSDGIVGISYGTSNGTATAGSDFTTASGTLSWPAADTANKTFVVNITNDTTYEGDETFTATLSAPTGNAILGSPSSATVTIVENDPIPPILQFTSATFSQSENVTTANLTVGRTGSSVGAVSVECANAGTGSATLTNDYTFTSPQTLNWADGDITNKNCVVTIVNDSTDENNETVNATLQTPGGGASIGAQNTTQLTITDDDNPPTVQWTAASQASTNEVNATTMTVTAQLSAASSFNVSVPFTVTGTATGGGTDYTITASPIAINAGATTGTATITIVGDALSEGNETVILTIGSPTNATASGTTVHTATITDDDGPVCTPAAMSISITPATQNVRAGFAITYTVMVTNNDSVECATLPVTLGFVDTPVTPTANFALTTLSSTSLNVAPQSSGSATLTVTAQPAGVETSTLSSQVTATAAGHANQIDTAVSTIMNYNPLIHSSKSTNSTKWGVNGWGVAGGRYGAFTCATCHVKNATPNIKRIKQTITTSPETIPGSGETVTLTTTTDTTANFAETAGNHATSNKICEVCHTYDASKVNGSQFHGYNMSAASAADQSHYLGSDCVKCHVHKQGFKASCDTCHDNPPISAAGLVVNGSTPGDATGSTTYGKHDKHVNTLSYACNTCHTGWQNAGEMPKAGNINIGFSTFGSTTGTYAGRSTGKGYTAAAGTTVTTTNALSCTVYCHGSTIGGAVASTWLHTDTLVCGDCHNTTAAVPPTLVNHPRHAGTGAGQLGLACNLCHGTLPTLGDNHLNGKVAWNITGLSGTVGRIYNSAISGETVNRAPSGSYSTCNNIYCHSNVQSANGTAAASVYAAPTWGAASVTCDSCHGQAGHTNGQPSSGSHEIHVTTRGYACSACHTGAGDETVNHADGQIDISLSGGGTYTQGNHTPGSGGYGTCSSVACHNGKITFTWGTTGSCIMCHTVDGTNSATVANPVSGLHGNTVTSVQDHDNTLAGGCEACHVKASITGHWNGVASVTADYTKAEVGITAAMYTDAGGVLATRGTCMGTSDLTSCHTDKGNWRRQWSTDADTDIVTGSKLPGQAVCNVCHGQYSTLTNSDGWSEGTVHYRSSDLADPKTEDKGIIHADAGDECEDCHGYDSVAVHNSNNKIDFSDLGNPSGYAVTLNATPNPDVWYCATCHTAQNAQVATLTASHTFLDSLAFPNATNPINHVTGTSTPQGACFGCHGDTVAKYWPDTLGADDGATTEDQAGAHELHMAWLANKVYGETVATLLTDTAETSDTKQRALCQYCHDIADTDHMSVSVADVFRSAPKRFQDGAVETTTGGALLGSFETTNNTCSNVDCHVQYGTALAGSEPVPTPDWYITPTHTFLSTQMNCSACHVNVTSNTTHTAHTGAATIYGLTINCASCHANSPVWGAPGTIPSLNHLNGTFTNGGSVTFTYAGTFRTSFGGCGTNNCHRADLANTAPLRSTYPWGTALTDDCASCHAGTAIATRSHTNHLSSNSLPATNLTYNSADECVACHSATTAGTGKANTVQHIDNGLDVSFGTTYDYEGTGTVASSASTGDLRTCSDVRCHNGVTTPTWAAASTVTCVSCHNTSSAGPLPGMASVAKSHAAHSNNDADYTDCDNCHGNATYNVSGSRGASAYTATGGGGAAGSGIHQNLTVNVYMNAGSGTYTETDGKSGVNYTGTDFADDGVCGTTVCHGAATPTWGGTLANGCFDCHGGGLSATETSNAKPLIDAIPNPMNNTQYTTQGHGRAATAFPGSTNLGPVYTYATNGCYNCHDVNAAHSPAASATDPFRLGATYAQNTDGLCVQAGCHDSPTILTHSKAVTGSAKTWPFTNYAYKCVDCHDPHGDTNYYMIRSAISAPIATNDTTIGSDNYGTPADAGNISPVTFTSTTGMAAGSYGISGTGNGICEVCHNGTNKYIRGSATVDTHNTATRCVTCHKHDGGFKGGGCSGCHAPGGSGPTVVYPTGTGAPAGSATVYGSHLKAMLADTLSGTTDWDNVQCVKCHPATAHKTATNVILIPNNTTVGINYPLVGGEHGGIFLGGTSTKVSPTSEADICWTCHDLQTTKVTEWGTNNGGTYNYGIVYTSSAKTTQTAKWIGTYWTSANFTYKEGLLNNKPTAAAPTTGTANGGSTHGVNAGTAGIDADTKIACSWCHDVHNGKTNNGTAHGKPYLRGSWISNPFPEDGAPQTTAHATTGGGVPRMGLGSPIYTTPNAIGGWQIGQNNAGAYTSGTTYATFAGLCQKCHTETTLETAWASHAFVVDGFNNGGGTSIFSTTKRGGSGTAQGLATSRGHMQHNATTPYDPAGYVYGLRGDQGTTKAAPWIGITPYVNPGRQDETAIPNGWGITMDANTVDANFHEFPCSKCHNPHASRLPNLLITNCLDVKRNAWDNAINPSTWPSATHGYTAKQLAYSSTAANCHRYVSATDANRETNGSNETGWNAVTPWQ